VGDELVVAAAADAAEPGVLEAGVGRAGAGWLLCQPAQRTRKANWTERTALETSPGDAVDVHEVEELGFVTAGGRTQGHPAGASGLAGGRHWRFLALPGCRGLTIVNHKTARYRVAGRLPAGRAASG